MAVAVGMTHHESDGRSIQLTPHYTIVKDQIVVIEGWLVIADRNAESGDLTAFETFQQERQLKVPTAFNPAVGDLIYIDTADLTGHTPDNTAYSISSGAGKQVLGKVTKVKDANDIVRIIFIAGLM